MSAETASAGERRARLLVVDDEPIALRNLERVLAKEGYEVATASSGQSALRQFRARAADVVLTDLRMEKIDGLHVLRRCKEIDPDVEVILVTGYAAVETAIAAMKQGAYHYLAKPFKLDEVRKVVGEAVEKVALKRENRRLRESIERFADRVDIVTQDPGMLRVLDTARDVTATDCTILITGESGTGKELVARYIHRHSRRAAGVFLAINCGAFTEELLTSELFGHEKGAFTGAAARKKGLVEMADGGTLFLDEITEMSPAMQVRLLRVLQEKEFIRVGGTEPVHADVRFLAATNRNLKEAIESGDFRQDLYYRLNVVTLSLPPLAERRDDIPMLAHFFLKRCSERMGKKVESISEEAMHLLSAYQFPGNVRELENVVERGVALAKGAVLEAADLPEDLRRMSLKVFRREDGRIPSLDDQERAYIEWVLKEVDGNRSRAAAILGIDRVSLWRKLKRYHVGEP
ncbi:MAG TPA: sigma-54 dependent transcriptional regulator [Anaeromyxobacteraceae bacterium]|nr:sigma-54 dependent transcriptional regulator [Anaeromyxobacteraceae bacterium]